MVTRGVSATVLVRGCGDVGSAVAHGLFGAGYRVLIHDDPGPAHTRRGMAFTDALAVPHIYGIGERPRRIADGVIAAIRKARSH